MATRNTNSPAYQLLGRQLDGGWIVTRAMGRQAGQPTGTGGHFGVGYVVERTIDGVRTEAFLKAMDLMDALNAPNRNAEILRLISLFEFEKSTLEKCAAFQMSRVVGFVAHGELYVPQGSTRPEDLVQYVITELGEGDIRRHTEYRNGTSVSVKLNVLREVSHGLAQMHKENIAHQDVKPSNVIRMPHAQPTRPPRLKLCDVGRVIDKSVKGPYDHLLWPGDSKYAPPEVLYAHTPPDWNDRREASDAYLLGNLMCFLFAGISLTSAVQMYLDPPHRRASWNGDYAGVMAPLITAWNKVLTLDVAPTLPDEFRDQLLEILRELTHPDPIKRGHPKARQIHGRPVGMDRYMQRFELLRKRSEIAERIEKGKRAP